MSVNIGSTVTITGVIKGSAAATGMTGKVMDRHVDADGNEKYDSYIVNVGEVYSTDDGGRRDWVTVSRDEFDLVTEGDGTVPDLNRQFHSRDYVEVNSAALVKQGVKGYIGGVDEYGLRMAVIFEESQTYTNNPTVEAESWGSKTDMMTVEPFECTLIKRLEWGENFNYLTLSPEEQKVAAGAFMSELFMRGIPEEIMPSRSEVMEGMMAAARAEEQEKAA